MADSGPAPCAGQDGIFFSTGVEEIAAAKAICAGCPRAEACYRGAAVRNEKFGVWGGVAFPREHRARGRLERERKAS